MPKILRKPTIHRHHILDGGEFIDCGMELGEITGVAGGGFRGGVHLTENAVLKTGKPISAFKEMLRHLNRGGPFEPSHHEELARMDSLAASMLHEVIETMSDGEIYVPRSYGYAYLGEELGYAQVIERVEGRIENFLNPEEGIKIDQARQRIWDICKEFGFAHGSQVHEGNPFGRPNLWIDANGGVIWLDFLPAFRMTGTVLPNPLPYKFHKEVNNAFGSDDPLFDEVFTDTLRLSLARHRDKFSPEIYDEILAQATLYDTTKKHFESKDVNVSRRSLRVMTRLAIDATAKFTSNIPYLRVLWNDEAQLDYWQAYFSPEYRQDRVIENTLLGPLRTAHKHGLINSEHLEEARCIAASKDIGMLAVLQGWYGISSAAYNVIAIPQAVDLATGDASVIKTALLGATVFVLPGITRAGSALALGRATEKNYTRLALESAIPTFGTIFAIPRQITRDYGDISEHSSHYAKRSIIAKLSGILPQGGWGSDLEKQMWVRSEEMGGKIRKLKISTYMALAKLGSIGSI